MIKNRYHTDVERGQIVALHKSGLSQRQISELLGINRSSVQRAIKKFNTEGILGNRIISGKPRKTTLRDDDAIRRIVGSSCKKVRAYLLKKETDVSVRTVFRRLKRI